MVFWKNRKNKMCSPASKVVTEVRNTRHIGEQLLLVLKNYPSRGTSSNDDDLFEDCVELECTRKTLESTQPTQPTQDNPVRAAHRCVLRAYSPHLREDLRVPKDKQRIKVDSTVAMLDLALEYMYTNRPINVNGSICIQLHSIAVQLGVEVLAKDTREYIKANMKTLLDDVDFLTKDRLKDVLPLADVFMELASDNEMQLRLVRKLHQWFSTMANPPPANSEESRTFSALVGNVLAGKRADEPEKDDEVVVKAQHQQQQPDAEPSQPTKKLSLKQRVLRTLKRYKRKDKVDSNGPRK